MRKGVGKVIVKPAVVTFVVAEAVHQYETNLGVVELFRGVQEAEQKPFQVQLIEVGDCQRAKEELVQKPG